jgi:beta-lactamase class A
LNLVSSVGSDSCVLRCGNIVSNTVRNWVDSNTKALSVISGRSKRFVLSLITSNTFKTKNSSSFSYASSCALEVGWEFHTVVTSGVSVKVS